MSNSSTMALTTIPQGGLDGYIQAVNSMPMLTADEERELAEELQETGSIECARRLVMSHLRFVVHVARGYSGYGLPQSDLIQEGTVGLMKAVKRFDPAVGVRLVSFAVHWIKAEIHEYVLRNWRIVKVATTKAQRKLFFNLRKSKKRLGWFSQDEIQNVANELGVSTREVVEMESRMSSSDQAFELASDDDDNAGSTYSPALYLEDKSSDVAEQVETSNWEKHAYSRLSDALSQLDERSQDIVRSRWLNDDNKTTLQELAAKYGVSAERVRQLEKNAMKKLKAAMGS